MDSVLLVANGGRRSISITAPNSVMTLPGLGSARANSALTSINYSTMVPPVSCPRSMVLVTVHTGARTSRSGVNITVGELRRDSPALAFRGGSRAGRMVVGNLNSVRVSITISLVGSRSGIGIRLSAPGITCHRAISNSNRNRRGRGGRANNRKRFNRICLHMLPGTRNSSR